MVTKPAMLHHTSFLCTLCTFSSTILDIGGRGSQAAPSPGLMFGDETEHVEHDNSTSLEQYDYSDYDSYESSLEDNVTSSELRSFSGRGLFDAVEQEYDDMAVLFEEDSLKDIGSRINFSENGNVETAEREERLFSFEDPENQAEIIRMKESEINKIFNKRKFRKNKRLTKTDRKKIRECRKKDKLFSRRDKKCYHPLTEEPCGAKSNKWFVARKSQIVGVGVCRPKPCLEDDKPISLNGTCVAQDDSTCPLFQEVVHTFEGEAICDCREGFSSSNIDTTTNITCHRDHMRGPCEDDRVWIQGKCRRRRGCGEGQTLWHDGECHDLDRGEAWDTCVADEEGVLILEVRQRGKD